jgi:hypothetical protein
LTWAIFGGLFGLVAALVITILLRGQQVPPLTQAAYDAAQARWQGNAPQNYLIEIRVTGAQPAVYQVTVQDRQVVSASRNGNPLTQERTWETWSVPGMFDTLASDLEHLQSRDMQLIVRCQFDHKYGYPARYERTQLGTGQQVSWEVTRFE